jgi:PII-like signaling protein
MDDTENGAYLRLYVQENRRHGGRLLHEWIVELARELELPGCSVFQAIAGYGHHGRMHRQSFLELQGEVPLEIVFALSTTQADALMARLRSEGVELFWIRTPAQFGLLPGSPG